jgi:hypothetical protein
MKTRNIKPTIKRSVAATLLGVTSKTLRRREIEGVLHPIKPNSRSTFYLVEEVEKMQRGEISAPSPVTLNTAPARAASGQFVGAA